MHPRVASYQCCSPQMELKRHGAGCGDARLGCWQIAGSSGHRRLSVIARSASRWTRAPAVQCCPRMIWGRASSERRSFIRYDKVSRSRGSNWRRGCRGGGPLGTGWRLKGHAPDAVLALSAPAPPSHIVVRLSCMATRPPCAAVDLRRDSDHHARAAHPVARPTSLLAGNDVKLQRTNNCGPSGRSSGTTSTGSTCCA